MTAKTLLIISLVDFILGKSILVEAQQSANNGSNADQSTTNIAFDLPDLTAAVETGTGTAQLEAYKSINNDQILRNTTGKRTSELFWVSVGLPGFIKTPDPRNRTIVRLFHFSTNGFSTYVEMMTAAQRNALANTARSKYRVDISENQVVNLILSRFQCTLLLYDEVGNKFLLNGKVFDFRNFPLRMDFVAPRKSIERKLFTEMISEGSLDADLQFHCSMESSGKVMKTNTLMISVDQQQQIGLVEKLFGPSETTESNDVYVTRDQMTGLADEMYSTLNIVEDYQMQELQFSEAFIDGLITQLSTSTFAQVPVDTVLASLSKYGIDVGADIQPDIIKRDVGKILTIETLSNKSKIILNETSYRQFTENQPHFGDGNARFLNLTASANWANGNSIMFHVSDDRALSDQLRELNTASQQEAQWAIEGNRVVPKSLNVARLKRSKMSKTLTFNRIRIQTYNAPFQRNFAIYTIRSSASISFLDQLSARITALQTIIDQTRVELTNKTTALNSEITAVAGTVQTLSTTVNHRTSTIDARIQQTRSELTHKTIPLNSGLTGVNVRVEALSTTVNQMASTIDTRVQQTRADLIAKTTTLSRELSAMSIRIQTLSTTVNQMKSTLNTRMEQVYAALQSAQSQLTGNINALSSKALRRCRICFMETEGSTQCQENRNSCSGWSDAGSVWTQKFRDDTDGRGGGCMYQWIIECQA